MVAFLRQMTPFSDMVGYDREDLVVGSPAPDGPDAVEWRDHDVRAVAELQMTGTIPPYEREYFRKDGSSRARAARRSIFEEGGNQGVVLRA